MSGVLYAACAFKPKSCMTLTQHPYTAGTCTAHCAHPTSLYSAKVLILGKAVTAYKMALVTGLVPAFSCASMAECNSGPACSLCSGRPR